MNIDETHPGLREELENGALSIRRTKQHFCRSAIDLTLEQTVNANAANRLTGITAFTNSLNARQRWSETHIVRTAIISELLEFLDLSKTNENTESEYQNKTFKKQLHKITRELENHINPFSHDLNKEKLFNLSTGKAASSLTTDFLMNVQSTGTKQMEVFIEQCQLDSKRFDKPIKRNPVCESYD